MWAGVSNNQTVSQRPSSFLFVSSLCLLGTTHSNLRSKKSLFFYSFYDCCILFSFSFISIAAIYVRWVVELLVGDDTPFMLGAVLQDIAQVHQSVKWWMFVCFPSLAVKSQHLCLLNITAKCLTFLSCVRLKHFGDSYCLRQLGFDFPCACGIIFIYVWLLCKPLNIS